MDYNKHIINKLGKLETTQQVQDLISGFIQDYGDDLEDSHLSALTNVITNMTGSVNTSKRAVKACVNLLLGKDESFNNPY